MNTYLFNHSKSKLGDNFTSTHTRIGDKDLNIYGGNYCIEDKEEFLKLYYKEIVENDCDEYLTEKQDKNGVIAIDLDFRYSNDVSIRQHNKCLEDIIMCVSEPLKEFYKFENDDEFDLFVLEKPNVNVLEDGSLTKDGIHFIIGLNMEFEYRESYRKSIINLLKESIELPLINDWSDVVDKGVIMCSNNWQMFGSKKPGNQKYNLSRAFKFTYDSSDKQFCWNEFFVYMTFDLFNSLSIQNLNRPNIQMLENKKLKLMNPSSPTSVVEIDELENKELTDKVKDLIEILRITPKQAKDRKLWFSICSFMIINKFKESDWEKFCKSNEMNWDNEKESLFTHLKPFKVEIFYIQKLAKENNYEEYALWLDKYKVTNDSKIKIGKNDVEVANILFGELKDVLKSYKGRIFYLKDNIWIYDENKIKDNIMQYIFKSNIHSPSAIAGLVPVCKSLSNAKTYLETLFIKIKVENEDEQLYNKFHLSTKGKLCFNDGVLDFINKKFITWEDVNKITEEKDKIYTTVKINKNFKNYFDNPNQKDMEDITTKIFNTAFGDKTNLAFHFFSRAIAGHYEDKRFGTYLGNRNCGKGVLYDLLKFAFEDYVNTFELGNLLYNRQTAGQENIDCSKKLYWLIDLEFVRLAINQEIPDSSSGLKVNGKMWKKITGGGDTIVARRNYDRKDTHFTSDATLYAAGNSSLQFDSIDCEEMQVQFNSVVQFKTSEEIAYLKSENDKKIKDMVDNYHNPLDIQNEQNLINMEMSRYMIADKTIKNTCKTIDWSYAIIMLLYNNYKTFEIAINKELDVEDNTLILSIKEMFDITNKQEDIILCSEVYAMLNKFDKKKIDNELNAINIFKKKSSKSGPTRLKMCFFGLNQKFIEEDDNVG